MQNASHLGLTRWLNYCYVHFGGSLNFYLGKGRRNLYGNFCEVCGSSKKIYISGNLRKLYENRNGYSGVLEGLDSPLGTIVYALKRK